MPVNPVDWVVSNPGLTLGGVILLVALAWAYDAWEEADDRREALEGFGSRAKEGTGGALNVVLVGVLGVVGAAAQAAGTLGELASWILGMVPDGPVIAAGLLNIGLGGIGLSSYADLHPLQFIGIAGFILVLAVAWRADLS